MAMVQLQSYGFTTVENPLSDGGLFSNMTGYFSSPMRVPSSGVCESTVVSNGCAFWNSIAVQIGDSWPADQYSEITVLTLGETSAYNVMFVRVQGVNGNSYYFANMNRTAGGAGQGSVSFAAVVTGTEHNIGGTTSVSYSVGDVFRLGVVGNVLTVYQNGSQVATVTDTNNYVLGAGNPGFSAYAPSAITNAQISKWAAGANQAATPTFSLAGTTLTISSTTSGGTIYYTTNGTTPTHSSSHISNGGTVSNITSGTTVKAFESATNFADSAIGSYNVASGSGSWTQVGRDFINKRGIRGN